MAVREEPARYQLDDKLGTGGMAEVFRARMRGAEGFERPVAVKRVLPGLAGDPTFAQLFVGEARLSARLAHPNIVGVLDFDRDAEGRPFLVMELVEGANLDALVETGALPWQIAAFVAAELLRGLGHAHDAGVLHRDVSPHNVLLSWRGEVKLSDFGLAKVRTGSHATASECLKGKPAYMSPEHANGEALDGRSDLFAVGVTLWEMLTGRQLFAGDSTPESLSRLLFAPIPSPRSLCPDVPEALSRVVMKLLARERTARYADAATALAALDACRARGRADREDLAALLGERLRGRPPVLAQGSMQMPRLPGPLDAPRPSGKRFPLMLALCAAVGVIAGLALGLRVTEHSAPTASVSAIAR